MVARRAISAPSVPLESRPAPAAVVQDVNAVRTYAVLLRERVQANLRVPATITLMHMSGTTTLDLRLAPDGAVLAVSVLRPSGTPRIDRAAMATALATAFPPFLAAMPRHPVVFVLQVCITG